MPLRTSTRRMLPLVALVLSATACGAPSVGESIAATPPTSAPAVTPNAVIAFPQQAPTLGPQPYRAREVLDVQRAYPRAGKFRVCGLLEQQREREPPSLATVERAMAINRKHHNAGIG